MQERGRREPREEGCVLHRVPRPVAAPAQYLVRPPGARHDAYGEERPRGHRPAPRRPNPLLVQLAAEQRADREREWHGQSDVAEVQHRRMKTHQGVILQQRVGPRSIRRHRENLAERVHLRRKQPVKEQPNESHHAPGERDEPGIRLPVYERHEGSVRGEDQTPEQDRALEAAPQGDRRVVRRRLETSDARHVGHAEVMREKRDLHRDECRGHGGEYEIRAVPGGANQPRPACKTAGDARDRHHQGSEKGRGEGSASDEIQHEPLYPSDLMRDSYICAGSSPCGGSYSLECLTIRFVDSKTPSCV